MIMFNSKKAQRSENAAEGLIGIIAIIFIVAAFVGIIISGFNDLAGSLPIGTLFSIVLGIIFAAAIFIFFAKKFSDLQNRQFR